jgi:NTE family protein
MQGVLNPLSLFAWLFVRLPLTFAIPFALASLWWVLAGFEQLNGLVAEPLARWVADFAGSQLPFGGELLVRNLAAFFHALVVIALFVLGFVVAYNLSALIHWIAFACGLYPVHYKAGPPQIPDRVASTGDPLADVERIGIVLAGGGAKGAYQAGAMRAIYEYLAQHNALHKVKAISGTSIGSWNALFWLGDLIKGDNGWKTQGIHEQWWRAISAKSLGAPGWYVPFCRNAFLSSAPWQRVFDHIFGQAEVRKQLAGNDVHFYLTRSNVRSGQLECVTNNPSPPRIPRVTYDILDRSNADELLGGMKAAVFASMDLPPLFPYARKGDHLLEDGGVIDNLPMQFAAMEGCDLIFVLPLNSDFEEEPNRTSILARLLRVMDVRQGVLERSAFKLVYLYNELAALRKAAEQPSQPAPEGQPGATHLTYALSRRNRQVGIFAVCPQKAFVQSTINTRELWKAKEAGIAFEVMRDATKGLLSQFVFEPQSKVRVAIISRGGAHSWDENF